MMGQCHAQRGPSESEIVLFHLFTFLRQFPFFPFLSKPTAIKISQHHGLQRPPNLFTDPIHMTIASPRDEQAFPSKLFIIINGDN